MTTNAERSVEPSVPERLEPPVKNIEAYIASIRENVDDIDSIANLREYLPEVMVDAANLRAAAEDLDRVATEILNDLQRWDEEMTKKYGI